MKQRLLATDERRHEVELDVRADRDTGRVQLAVLRHNRREAKSDRAVVLSASSARELMKRLQAAADEADRRAYVKAKAATSNESLEVAVKRVAAALEGPAAETESEP